MVTRRAQDRGGRVLAVAVLVDTVVGPVTRAGVALGIAVVAIAAAEETRVAIVVEVEEALALRDELAGQTGARRGRLARRLVFRNREDRHERAGR
jgi:hypothetical protein